MLTLSVKLFILSFNTNVTIFSLEMTCLSLWVFKNICQVAVLNALSHYEKYEQNQIFALSNWSFSFSALFQFYSFVNTWPQYVVKSFYDQAQVLAKQVTVKDTVFIGVNLNGIMKYKWLWWHIWPVCIHMHMHVHMCMYDYFAYMSLQIHHHVENKNSMFINTCFNFAINPIFSIIIAPIQTIQTLTYILPL